MQKTSAAALAILLAGVAVATPVFLALHFAEQQIERQLTFQAGLLAQDVLRRTEATTDQIAAAIDALAARRAPNPCSADTIAVMAQFDVSSSMLQAVGYVKDNRLICSSNSALKGGIAVGPPDYVSARGVEVRTSVTFPSMPATPFVLTNRAGNGYTAIVHRNLALDVFVDIPQVALGVYGRTSRRLILQRGHFDPVWIEALGDAPSLDLVHGDYVVAIRRSSRYDTAAYAAIPAALIRAGMPRLAGVLVPIGIVAGLVLALVVWYAARVQLALPAVLKVALRRNQFFLEYQPIVDLRSGAWVGAEALIRWRRSSGELMSPDVFIPVAEQTQLIGRITERVAQLAARDAGDLFERHPGFHLTINLSAADLNSGSAVTLLRKLAQATGATAGNLWVEATERGFLKAEAAREVVHDLRASGVRVGIDDFGTGYSGLSYLGSYEIDFLKIDKSFVEAIGTDAPTSHVVQHIIEMAQSLKLEMVAEGIETEAQARYLRDRGVRHGQGYVFARPMPMAQLITRLASHAPRQHPARPAESR